MIKKHKNLQSNNGFTLVEIAIVVIIVGLIITGVIQGSRLIELSSNQAILKQMNEFDSGLSLFRLKYIGIPGDMAANKIGGGVTYSGNNNGKINDYSGCYPILSVWHEPYYFFEHLSKKKYVNIEFNAVWAGTEIGQVIPKIAGGNKGGFTVTYYKGNHHLFFGINRGGDHLLNRLTGGVFTPEQAEFFDLKIDNGVPLTGKILAVNGATGNSDNPTQHSNCASVNIFLTNLDVVANKCITSQAENKYNLTNTNTDCMLFLELNNSRSR